MLIYLSLPRNRFSYLVITFLHTILSESGCRIARSVITDMVRRSHGSNCVMSTEVCYATLFAGRMEFCFVCLGQCSLNQSIRSDSQHCHKQSIFHEEKHLPEIEGDTFRMNVLGNGKLWKKVTTEYLRLLLLNRNQSQFHRTPSGRHCPYPEMNPRKNMMMYFKQESGYSALIIHLTEWHCIRNIG